MVDPAGEGGRAVRPGRIDVSAVDADRRRAGEAELRRFRVRRHLTQLDLDRQAARLENLLEQVLAERGLAVPIELREVTTDAEAAALRFPGSPTIRVDGRDVDPDGADAPPGLNCRIYHLPDGRVSPVPSRAQLEEALDELDRGR